MFLKNITFQNQQLEDPDDFAFGEMLRSAKEVKDQDYK